MIFFKNKHPDQSSLPKRQGKKILFFTFIFAATILLIWLVNQYQNLYSNLTELVIWIETPYQQWLEQQNTSNPFFLVPAAFGGGLIASISPCILSLLPINLSYIGTLTITSRRDAFVKASLFTLGVTTIFSLLGLFTSLASAVLLDYRGYTDIVIGTIIFVMGLSFAGLFYIPLPNIQVYIPFANPYTVGLTFALLTSPCGSPVLFAVLIAASNLGSPLVSTLTMVSYSLGYSAVIFFASLFTGLVKQSHFLLRHSKWIIRLGSTVLILAGLYYLWMGVATFF